MRKLIIAFMLCLIVSFPGVVNAAGDQEITVWINNQKQEFQSNAFLSQGTTFVPLRDIFEALGAKVEWSAERKEATAKKNDNTIIIKIGSTTALVNNKLHTMPQAPILTNDRTMVPIRFISEALDAKVTWNASEKKVEIITKDDSQESQKENIAEDGFLTYKEAINLGIRKSAEYNSAIIGAERAKENNENLYLTLGSYDLGMLQAKKDLNLHEKWAEMQVQITADRIGNQIRNQMDDLSLLIESKKNLTDKIEFLKYKNRMEDLKYQNGTISKLDLLNAKSELDNAIRQLSMLQTEIEGEYLKLSNSIGYAIDKKPLEYVLDYEEIGPVDLEKKIMDDTSEDPYIWYTKENLETKEFKLVTYEYNVAEKSYKLTALDLSEARKNSKDTKEALASVIKQRHHQLLQMEERIRDLELQLEQTKRSVNIIRLRYDVGTATKAQVEEVQLNTSALEQEIVKLQQQHGQMKVLFEKPYLAPEYFSAM